MVIHHITREDDILDNILMGAYDLHIHFGPDVYPRICDEYDMAKRAVDIGMKGFGIKSHFTPTAQRAAMIRKLFPKINAVGGIVLNNSVGGINPTAVETTARLGGKFVWFPTFDALQDQERLFTKVPAFVEMQIKLRDAGMMMPGITILNENGKLINAAYDVLEIIKEYDLVLCTGHMSPKESFALIEAAHEKGIKRIVASHVDWCSTYYGVEEQKELIKLGAILEHCYITPSIPYEVLFRQIKEVGTENVFLSTDLGSATLPKGYIVGTGELPYPDVGLKNYAELALQHGFTYEQVREMIVTNPAKIVE